MGHHQRVDLEERLGHQKLVDHMEVIGLKGIEEGEALVEV
jgi:hypothetical protein